VTSRLTPLYLAVAILAWGGNWILMKLVVADIPASVFTAMRVIGAAAVVVAFLLATRRPLLPLPEERWSLAIVGFLQIAVLLSLGILGLRHVSAGRAVVLTYTMQIWAIPLERWLVGQRMPAAKLIGAAVSLAGLLLYMEPGLVDWTDTGTLVGNGLLLAGAIVWALGAVLYRRRPWRSDVWTQTAWQLLVSIPPLCVAALFGWDRPVVWSTTLVAVFVFNWTVPTALAYWCWARVLTVMPAGTAGQWLLLTPVFAYVASVVVFGDAVTLPILTSIVLILAGLLVTVRAPSRITATVPPIASD
jgi:drug/metabolite transporter (DMT)-like permease